VVHSEHIARDCVNKVEITICLNDPLIFIYITLLLSPRVKTQTTFMSSALHNYNWTFTFRQNANNSFTSLNIRASNVDEARRIAIIMLGSKYPANIINIIGDVKYLVSLFEQNSHDIPYGVLRYRGMTGGVQMEIPQDANISWYVNNTWPKVMD
jgi:hypothetical protein